MNDRADLAVLAGFGGVHVGQEDLSPEDARNVLGSARWMPGHRSWNSRVGLGGFREAYGGALERLAAACAEARDGLLLVAFDDAGNVGARRRRVRMIKVSGQLARSPSPGHRTRIRGLGGEALVAQISPALLPRERTRG